MAATCPAPDCNFTGSLDQVQGHFGGCSDASHDIPTKTFIEEGTERQPNRGSSIKPLLLVLIGIGVVVYLADRGAEPEKFWSTEAGGEDQDENTNESPPNQGTPEGLATEVVA